MSNLTFNPYIPSCFFIKFLANNIQITTNPNAAAPPTIIATVFPVVWRVPAPIHRNPNINKVVNEHFSIIGEKPQVFPVISLFFPTVYLMKMKKKDLMMTSWEPHLGSSCNWWSTCGDRFGLKWSFHIQLELFAQHSSHTHYNPHHPHPLHTAPTHIQIHSWWHRSHGH